MKSPRRQTKIKEADLDRPTEGNQPTLHNNNNNNTQKRAQKKTILSSRAPVVVDDDDDDDCDALK